MPHVHDLPGQIDFTVEVLVVYRDRVLLRWHDKHAFWLSVGGHIELDEDPVEAARREVREEVGLDVRIDDSHMVYSGDPTGPRELVPPVFMCRVAQGPSHEHVTLTYFATCVEDAVRPSGSDRSDVWRWFTRAEFPEFGVSPSIQHYAFTALDRLASPLSDTEGMHHQGDRATRTTRSPNDIP